MKKRICFVLFALLFVIAFSFAGCETGKGGEEKTFAIEDIVVKVGESEQIRVTEGAESGEITYTFPDQNISIENGVVFGLVGGTVTVVTAKCDGQETTFTVTVEKKQDTSESQGLKIEDINAWIGYPASDFIAEFADGAEGTLSFEYDEAGLSIDAQACTVTALREGIYTVTARAGELSTQFQVTCKSVDVTDSKFSVSSYNAYATTLLSQWQEEGNDGETTVFIGDSYFDARNFWADFYDTYAGKDALCLGIGATTTYHWETLLKNRFSDIRPKNFVIHLGTNNVYSAKTTNSFPEMCDNLSRLFTLMHGKYPDAKIYYFGISQRTYDQGKIRIVSKVNDWISQWCEDRAYITYIDTPSKLTPAMSLDNTHIKPEYYYIFTDALAQTDIVILDKTIAAE